ncbi:UbiA prenyltransferase family [Gautieria morchelliformis]|nr:UbiA prenyltransferase family [Gautieria morchelliformis]
MLSFVRFPIKLLKTLFLFTKSDIKTILIPVTIFSVATAPLHDRTHLPQLMLWVWLHLLQFNLANQSLNPNEDAANKPDRPIPSGRITVQQARILRWGCLIPCLMCSACFSTAVVQVSAASSFFFYAFNELGFDSHWFGRHVLNGAGLACFEIGATLIAGPDRTTLGPTSKLAILVSTSIFITTNHTQDFKDVFGDKKVGRQTLPIIFPIASRVVVFISMVVWSLGLVYLWNLGPIISTILLTLASFVGSRFVFLKSVLEDQRSYYLYNVWLSLASALPAFTFNVV